MRSRLVTLFLASLLLMCPITGCNDNGAQEDSIASGSVDTESEAMESDISGSGEIKEDLIILPFVPAA